MGLTKMTLLSLSVSTMMYWLPLFDFFGDLPGWSIQIFCMASSSMSSTRKKMVFSFLIHVKYTEEDGFLFLDQAWQGLVLMIKLKCIVTVVKEWDWFGLGEMHATWSLPSVAFVSLVKNTPQCHGKAIWRCYMQSHAREGSDVHSEQKKELRNRGVAQHFSC